MAQPDNVDSFKVAYIAVVGMILVLLTVILVDLLYSGMKNDDFYRKNVAVAPRALRNYQAEQQLKLSQYTWVDKNTQTVTIPIEQAKALVLQELRNPKLAAPNESAKPAPK